jgi:hypothetical protein
MFVYPYVCPGFNNVGDAGAEEIAHWLAQPYRPGYKYTEEKGLPATAASASENPLSSSSSSSAAATDKAAAMNPLPTLAEEGGAPSQLQTPHTSLGGDSGQRQTPSSSSSSSSTAAAAAATIPAMVSVVDRETRRAIAALKLPKGFDLATLLQLNHRLPSLEDMLGHLGDADAKNVLVDGEEDDDEDDDDDDGNERKHHSAEVSVPCFVIERFSLYVLIVSHSHANTHT